MEGPLGMWQQRKANLADCFNTKYFPGLNEQRRGRQLDCEGTVCRIYQSCVLTIQKIRHLRFSWILGI